MTPKEAIQELKDASDSEVRYGDTEHHYDEVMKRVEALDMAIKALEQTRWIPVSERLPEEDGDYLVTTKWKGSYSGDVYIETHVAYYRKKSKEWDCVDIIAWMPLPQPYKESEDKE